jgi:hypothetical protein
LPQQPLRVVGTRLSLALTSTSTTAASQVPYLEQASLRLLSEVLRLEPVSPSMTARLPPG